MLHSSSLLHPPFHYITAFSPTPLSPLHPFLAYISIQPAPTTVSPISIFSSSISSFSKSSPPYTPLPPPYIHLSHHPTSLSPTLHHTCQLLRIFRKLYGFFVPLRAYGRRGISLRIFFIHEIINFSPFDMLILFEIVQLAR